MRRTRPLIALAAAYGLTVAAVLGAISAGRMAAFGAASFCQASDVAGNQGHVPVRHDLACCTGCCSGASSLPAPAVTPALTLVAARIVWPAKTANLFRSPVGGCPSARAPPVVV